MPALQHSTLQPRLILCRACAQPAHAQAPATVQHSEIYEERPRSYILLVQRFAVNEKVAD